MNEKDFENIKKNKKIDSSVVDVCVVTLLRKLHKVGTVRFSKEWFSFQPYHYDKVIRVEGNDFNDGVGKLFGIVVEYFREEVETPQARLKILTD